MTLGMNYIVHVYNSNIISETNIFFANVVLNIVILDQDTTSGFHQVLIGAMHRKRGITQDERSESREK